MSGHARFFGRLLAMSSPRSQASGPSLLEWAIVILVTRFAGELPTMVLGRYGIGKCQGQGIGEIGAITNRLI